MLLNGRAGAVNKAILYNGHVVAFFRENRSECTWSSNHIFISVIYEIRFNNNSLKAFYYADGKTYESKTLNFEIVDRVGGGDAFSSGLIYALMQNDWKHEDIVNFAVASSVMKHAIRGDTNITSVEQIKRLMNNASFDVQR